jgi:hypothetical protein
MAITKIFEIIDKGRGIIEELTPENLLLLKEGGGGAQTLSETLDNGNVTGGFNILINDADAIELENTSLLKKGTYDYGGDGGISRICSVGFEDMWQSGFRHVFDNNGLIRHSTNCFDVIPDETFDDTLRFKIDSLWTLDNGTTYKCLDASTGAAIWELYNVGGIPTLQEVLDNNHDLVDGIFNAGTLAGDGNTGYNQNALGYEAGSDNSGINQNALGERAGEVNTGDNQNALGWFAGASNSGYNQNTLGYESGASNSGDNQNALGYFAGFYNTGTNQNALGNAAGQNNTGNNQNALGNAAGVDNAFNNVNLFGENAQADEDGQTVLSKDGTIMARISTADLTDTRKYTLPDADGTIALTTDIPTLTSQLTNDGEDGVNPFISLANLPYQIEIYDDSSLFPLVGNDDIVYLAEDTGIFYLWDGTDSVYNQITSNAFPTGLEKITEGSNTGWRLIGRNPANYGNIGMNAVDISSSLTASSTRGAQGEYSFAQGRNTRASATAAVAFGDNTQATSQYAFAHGTDSQATNNSAEAGGNNTAASGNSSVAKGTGNRARSLAEFSIGQWGTDYTPVSASSATNTTDRVFNLGNGLSDGTRSDAFTVFKNGAVKLFVGALASITNGVAGFFTFNSTDSNRPYIHNGTAWKGLAYNDDIPTNTSDLVNDGEDGTSPYVTADQLPSNLNLYATNVSSDIATYFKLVTSIDDPDYNDTAVNIPTGAITTTGQFIAALATTANVLVGNPGIINILTIGNVRRTSGTGTAEFYYEVYHRTSGGTETLIATSSNTPPVNSAIYTEFLAAALLNNGTFLATDRIVVKYYADRVAGGSNPEYDFQFGGTSPVRTNFPIPATNIPLDATPTDGSTNGVQSNGVFDALALKANKENNYFLNWFPTGSIITINNYTSTVSSTAFSSTTSNSNNLTKLQPFVTNKTITIDELYLSLATANNGTGSTATLYIFDDSNDGLPGVKLHQEITATGIFTAGNSIISFTNNITLQPGVYWIGIHIRDLNTAGTNPTFYHASLGGNTKGYQTAAISFTNNYLGTLFVGATTGDLGNNPTILVSAGTSLLLPMLKIKIG